MNVAKHNKQRKEEMSTTKPSLEKSDEGKKLSNFRGAQTRKKKKDQRNSAAKASVRTLPDTGKGQYQKIKKGGNRYAIPSPTGKKRRKTINLQRQAERENSARWGRQGI